MIDPEIEIEARHESLHTGTYRVRHGMYELLEDFWAQFDAAQELDELRMYRPAIYQALPAAPPPEMRSEKSEGRS